MIPTTIPRPKSSALRTITNPILHDEVVFLETSRETNGRYTLVEVSLAAGGGNPLHYHEDFAEAFTCVEGELSLQVDQQIIRLQPGESATAPAKSKHRFFNQTNKPCRFLCRIEPGCPGFEQFLQLTYGLARDGKANAQSAPKNPYELGYLIMISGTYLTGWMSLLQPLLRWLGKRAIQKGIAADLQRRYLTIW